MPKGDLPLLQGFPESMVCQRVQPTSNALDLSGHNNINKLCQKVMSTKIQRLYAYKALMFNEHFKLM